jgi:hypothetical protein
MTLPRYSSGSAPQQPRFDGALLHDCRATTDCARSSLWHGRSYEDHAGTAWGYRAKWTSAMSRTDSSTR